MALVLIAAVLWGTTGTAQSLAPGLLSPLWVGAWRLALAGGFFLVLLSLRHRATLAPAALVHLPWWPMVGAALCMALYNLAFFAGVRASGIAVGTAIALGSGPIWAGLLQAVIGAGAPNKAWWIGTALAVTGGVLMVTGPAADGPARFSAEGTALCLTAGLAYAVYATLNQRMVTRAAPATVTGIVFTLAALMAVPLAGWLSGASGWPEVTSRTDLALTLSVLLWLGVAATGVAYLCFSHALRHIPAATGVTLALAEPVTAFLLAVLLVGERPGLTAAIGLLAVLGGLLLVMKSEWRAPRTAVH